jgi:pimeloyl-ACP methyl ester carboxylesterase
MAYATNPDDGVRVFYEAVGHGTPLVLLHGSATSSLLWRALGYVDALKARYRVVVLDARGHGRSDKPRDEDAYAIERIAADVVAVLDDDGLERVHYAGYSLGGRVALALGFAAPERFRSLVIGAGSHRPQRGALDRILYPGCVETIATEGIEAFLDAWSRHKGGPIPNGLRALFRMNDEAALASYLRRTEEEPGFPETSLARLTMPILLFAGQHDEERLADSAEAGSALPDARLVVIPGEDHQSTLMSRHKVLPPVESFLAGVDRAALRS